MELKREKETKMTENRPFGTLRSSAPLPFPHLSHNFAADQSDISDLTTPSAFAAMGNDCQDFPERIPNSYVEIPVQPEPMVLDEIDSQQSIVITERPHRTEITSLILFVASAIIRCTTGFIQGPSNQSNLNFSYSHITLQFQDRRVHARFLRQLVTQQVPKHFVVGSVFPGALVIIDFTVVHWLLHKYDEVPLVLRVINVLAFAGLGLFFWFYIAALRRCLEDYRCFSLVDLSATGNAAVRRSVNAGDDAERSDSHVSTDSTDSAASDGNFAHYLNISFATISYLITILGYNGIMRQFYAPACKYGCATSSFPTQNLVWVIIWYVPMHAWLSFTMTWSMMIAVELYSKAIIVLIFSLHYGADFWHQNVQMILIFSWIFISHLVACYAMHKKQMVAFIQREQLLQLAAEEEKDFIMKNLLYVI